MITKLKPLALKTLKLTTHGIREVVVQISRIAHELALSGFLLFAYFSGSYIHLAPTLQTIMLKVTLTSLGFIHAHIVNKISFPNINWERDDVDKMEKILRIVIYAVFVHAYSVGG